MTLRVVRLGPADAAILRALNAVFGAAFDEPETYRAAPPDEAYLADKLRQPHIIVLAAMVGDEVIGGLVAYELAKLEQPRSEIYIYDLAVADAWRRRGVATALIEHVRQIARERGAWTIFVQGDYGDDPALALYGKLGTREAVLHFDIAP